MSNLVSSVVISPPGDLRSQGPGGTFTERGIFGRRAVHARIHTHTHTHTQTYTATDTKTYAHLERRSMIEEGESRKKSSREVKGDRCQKFDHH